MALATLALVQLAWEERGTVATLRVAPAHDRPGASTTLRFTATGGRVQVGLVLLDGRREIDVSIQPALVVRAVDGGADPCDAAAATAQVCGWLASFAGAHGVRCPEDPVDAGLLAVVGGASFPLLGAAVAGGAAPLEEVPRWAVGALAAPTARAGAEAAFPGRATRPVVSALAGALVSGVRAPARGGGPVGDRGTVALYPLALARMAPALGPDRLTRVLRGTGRHRAPAEWPEVDLVDLAAGLTPHLGEHRTERLLLDAARLDDGPVLLAESMEAYGLVRRRAGARLPNRLAEFREHCRSLLPADPNPSGVVAPTRRRPRTRAATARRPPAIAPQRTRTPAPAPAPAPAPTPDERRRAMFHAPRTRGPQLAEHVPLDHPAAVLALRGREVHGAAREPLRLLVPRTGAELAAWGERLHNCVGGFGAAVNEHRSIVVGVESGDRLVYCIDVRPDGVIRQFLATHNRPVPRPDALAVVQALAAAGVVRADASANEHWFDPV